MADGEFFGEELHRGDSLPSERAGPGWPRRVWLRTKLVYLRGKRSSAQAGGSRSRGSRGAVRYSRIDPKARLNPHAVLIAGKIRAVEKELGIERIDRSQTQTPEEHRRGLDERAATLARWREEDAAEGRIKK